MWTAETFDVPKIFVPGNHEFYGHRRLLSHNDKMRAKAEELGVHFLQNDYVIIDGVRFIGCTLWTDFALCGDQPLAMIRAMMKTIDGQTYMNDYTCISQGDYKSSKLRPNTVLAEYKKSLDYLMFELTREHDGPTVVVTHHAPSEQSCLPEKKANKDNAYYASNLDSFVAHYNPALWVHGHVHYSRDYMIDDTRVVTNPRGYMGRDPNRNFDPNLLLEV